MIFILFFCTLGHQSRFKYYNYFLFHHSIFGVFLIHLNRTVKIIATFGFKRQSLVTGTVWKTISYNKFLIVLPEK